MKSATPKVQVLLANHPGLGRIVVDVEPFFELSFSLAEDLQQLVGRWKHFAAPKDRHPQRRRSQFRR